MDILITGAASAIGTALAQALLRAGHGVVAFDRNPVRCAHDRFRPAQGDVCNIKELLAAANGCDAGIHLAVLAGETPAADMISNNVTGAFNFLETARRQGFNMAVIASSAPVHLSPSAFDNNLDGGPVKGDTYDLSKYLQEITARGFHAQGVPVLCLRFGHVVRGELQQQLDSNEGLERLDYCKGGWVALEDVVDGCTRALESGPDADFRVYNLVGSRGGRHRFDVRKAERKLGFELRFDFAGFD